jgi:hypothetical protein
MGASFLPHFGFGVLAGAIAMPLPEHSITAMWRAQDSQAINCIQLRSQEFHVMARQPPIPNEIMQRALGLC